MYFYKKNENGSIDGYTTSYQVAMAHGWTETSEKCPIKEPKPEPSLKEQVKQLSTAVDFLILGDSLNVSELESEVD